MNDALHTTKRAACRRRGFTLVELMISLIIFALVASAAGSLLYSTLNTNTYVSSATGAASQVDLAMDRMIENLRSASWAQAYSPNQLYLKTENDPNNNNQPDTLEYSLNSSAQLTETNTLYGSTPLVLASNVQTFSVTLLKTGPTLYRITLVLKPPSSPAVTRNCDVACRNF